MATLHRKRRVVPRLVAAEHGWNIGTIGVLVFADGRTANRTVIARHAATFGAAFPGRAVDARSWLAMPSGPLAAVWLVDPRARRRPIDQRRARGSV